MSFPKGLFGGKHPSAKDDLFQSFSDAEKRKMLDWNASYLIGEKKRREGKFKVVDLTGDQSLVQRLSDKELDTLIEVRELYIKADSISGPEAISLYKTIAILVPWDELCLMSIGIEYAQAGNFKEGIPWLEKALALNPSNDRVRSNLEAVKAASRSRSR